MHPEEEVLAAIRDARTGMPHAWEILAKRYASRVYRYAYWRISHREDAEDLSQDTFIRAYQNLATFRGDSEKQFEAWLLAICANLCMDELRKRSRRNRIARIESLDAMVGCSADYGVSTATLAALIVDSRTGLDVEWSDPIKRMHLYMSRDELDVYVLTKVHGYRKDEVAAIRGVQVDEVTELLRAARRKLGSIREE